MPAFDADYFGSANVVKIYGLMLTTWSFGGVLGPLLISRVVEASGAYAVHILANLVVSAPSHHLSSVLPRPPARQGGGAQSEVGG